AFEPFEGSINILEEKFGDDSRVKLYHAAASTIDGAADLFFKLTSPAGHSLCSNKTNVSDENKPVKTINFSKWMKENLSKDDYIILKMNIEGAEYDVLESMINDKTISMVNEFYCEWHSGKIPGANDREKSVINEVNKYGFEMTGNNALDDFWHSHTRHVNFLLGSMTFLRYFIPITEELNRRGIKSKYFYETRGTKYESPPDHMKSLIETAKNYDISLYEVNDISSYPSDITFLVEGVGYNYIAYKTKKVSLTYQVDFRLLYDKYINDVDIVIFPSKLFAEYYDKVSDKNLYLGSTKYDINLDRDKIFNKYGIPSESRVVTLFAPSNNEIEKVDVQKINKKLSDMGYYVIVKSRGKSVTNVKFHGDMYLEDFSWHPHTSMELITISDFVVNFDSTTIKESIMLETPIINFDIRGDRRRVPFLYEGDFCVMLTRNYTVDELERASNKVCSQNFSDEFKNFKDKFLFHEGNVSKNIMDELL
ncbi:MAG: FkbM family methyltransferase, partial [Synergistaceae bacterium]